MLSVHPLSHAMKSSITATKWNLHFLVMNMCLKMKKDEVVNLIKYLQTDSQVEIPK